MENEEQNGITFDTVSELSSSNSCWNAPRDEESIERMREILKVEFNYEIKKRFIQLKEIRKRKRDSTVILDRLKTATGIRISDVNKTPPNDDYYYSSDDGNEEYVTQSDGIGVHYETYESSTLEECKKLKIRPHASILYARLPDDSFVKLICPSCKRVKFCNKLGFINHCRILHSIQFPSYQEASIHCGVPVNEKEVPLDDPCREKPDSSKSPMTVITPPPFSLATPSPSPSPNDDAISRFYVRKTFLLGNTSKYIRLEDRNDCDASYKWMAYVKCKGESIENFVSMIKFFLDSSYKPHDIVEVTSTPFAITRRGWGEFPVRAEIHFHNHINKRPVSLIHQLLLDSTQSGLQVGKETPFEIDLNKDSFVTGADVDQGIQGTQSTNDCNKNPQVVVPVLQVELEPAIDSKLRQVIPHFPLISTQLPSAPIPKDEGQNGAKTDDSGPSSIGYTVATSLDMYYSWSIGRRLAAEWLRASSLQKYLLSELKIKLSLKAVRIWCRTNNFTPPPSFLREAPSPSPDDPETKSPSPKSPAQNGSFNPPFENSHQPVNSQSTSPFFG